jgi:hypothetical protein
MFTAFLVEKLSKASSISSCKLQFNLIAQRKTIFRARNFGRERISAKAKSFALTHPKTEINKNHKVELSYFAVKLLKVSFNT